MKKATTFLIAVLSIITFSCSDSSNDPVPTGSDFFIRFKANDVQLDLEPESITSLSTVIKGFEGEGETYHAISLWIPNDATVGVHSIEPNTGSQTDIYSATYNQTFDLTADATAGTLEITNITADYIEGTFIFAATDANGNVYNITEGEFRSNNSLPVD